MKTWLAAALLLFSHLLAVPRPEFKAEFRQVSATADFGRQVTFQAQIEANEPIADVYILVQPQGMSTYTEKITLNTQGEVLFAYDVSQLNIYPFARVQYWYKVTAKSGSETTSPKYSFEYTDNRFQWKESGDERFKAFWYTGDTVFGQNILNVASQGLESAQKYLQADAPTPLRIYVYANSADLQSALRLPGQSWVAGHASPELEMILISIPPGSEARLEMERQIPHEIMHILQYEVMGKDYQRMPTWLMEGMASLAELYPNSDYPRALSNAASQGSLLPIQDLCGPFRREASVAFLSYAQSASFVRYLHSNYGQSGMKALMKQYGDGLSCAAGTESALNVSLSQLDLRWRQEMLGLNSSSLVLRNLAPYLLVAALIFLPLVMVLLNALRAPKHPRREVAQ